MNRWYIHRQKQSCTFGRVSGKNASSGFSLVELMVVILIIGVLAAVAVPIYRDYIQRAIRAEGEAALGSIRTQVRAYYAEWGEYPISELSPIMTQDWHDIKSGELNGANFTDMSYYYQCLDGQNYLIGVHRGTVMEFHRSLNQDGEFQDWDVKVDEE